MINLNVFSSIIDNVGNYFTKRQEIKAKESEHENLLREKKLDSQLQVVETLATANVELAKQGISQTYDLDKIATQDMRESYKDEFIMLVVFVPVILAFIPNFQEPVLEGFNVISRMPEWYVTLVIGISVVTFGLRGLLKELMSRGLNNLNLFSKTKQRD